MKPVFALVLGLGTTSAFARSYRCQGLNTHSQIYVIEGAFPKRGQTTAQAHLKVGSDKVEDVSVNVGFGAGLFSIQSQDRVSENLDVTWDLRAPGESPTMRWITIGGNEVLVDTSCNLDVHSP